MSLDQNEKKHEILKNAFDVFLEEGFEDTTFQKIADRSQITRTTLYQYFRNKLDIFNYSIQIFMKDVENEIQNACAEAGLDAVQKLTRTIKIILDRIEKNKKLLTVVLDFLINIHNDSEELNYHLRKRTIRFRHIISGLVIDGVQSGDLREIDLTAVNDMFFSLLEAAIFELAVFKRKDLKHILPSYEKIIFFLKK
jgi:AcrR family transcriptional regulator